MSLLLHSQQHLEGGAPTGRIFEAAAANTVIISDKHPFIMQQFGDNVLYIDMEQTGEEIFAEIDSHIQWVKDNPEKSKEMANNCHQILLEKFTLEAQLQKLIDLNDELNLV